MFLYIDPLKQGLKLKDIKPWYKLIKGVFIHRSIKTRIETNIQDAWEVLKARFLYIDPLKQGLKLNNQLFPFFLVTCFYT